MGAWDLDFYHRPLSPDPSFNVTEEMLLNAGIERLYWKCSISEIPDDCAYKAELTDMVKCLPKDERAGRGAVFWGKHGSGKTSAADIILKAAMARGGQCYHRMAGRIRHSYEKRWIETNRDGIEVWDLLTNSQLLVIDDLGHELAASGYQAGDIRIVEELIRVRYDKKLTTYITTNLPIPELVAQYKPIATILLEKARYRTVEVAGCRWRRGED